MVTVSDNETLRIEARTFEWLAGQAYEFYSYVEPDADLTKAREHQSNLKDVARWNHHKAVIANAARVIDAVNVAIKDATVRRFDFAVGPVERMIQQIKSSSHSFNELNWLEEDVKQTREEIARLSPERVYYCSREQFDRIPGWIRDLTGWEANGASIQRLQRDLQVILTRVEQADQTFPRGDRRELLEVEGIIGFLSCQLDYFGPVNAPDEGHYEDAIKEQNEKISSYLHRMQLAFRPPSVKKVKQRGRERVAKRSSHGSGRYARSRQ